jgi:hypothetical protein
VELSKFATDKELADTVRQICHSHAEDEAVHSSQFRALGRWLWEEFGEDTKVNVSRFFVASTIARSLPDLDRFVDMMQRATGRTRIDCERIVYSEYNEDMLIDEMLIAAKPTIAFLEQLGTEEYVPLSQALGRERERVGKDLARRRKIVGGH